MSGEPGAEQTPAAEERPPEGETSNLFLLATRSYLDKKINVETKTPRLVETVKDEAGNILIHKYDKLTRPIWQKYRTKPDFRPLHFICEIPIFVIDGINTSFLLPEDFQFLGALYSGWNNDAVAEQFMNEALKAGTADAHINAGVFRYHRGARGVMDNFHLAKKHFNKALNILHQMPLTVDEKHQRRKLCEGALAEIDYRAASFLVKLIRFIFRLITFQFEAEISYIGAAAPKELRDFKIQQMTEGILKREFDLKKNAFKKFIAELHSLIPPAQSYLADELQEIETDYGGFQTAEQMETSVTRLGEFVSQNQQLLGQGAPTSSEPAPGETPAEEAEASPELLAYEMASNDDIEKFAARCKLISPTDLVTMAADKSIEPGMIAWLILEKRDLVPVMEKLSTNPSVPDHVKKTVRRFLPQTPTE